MSLYRRGNIWWSKLYSGGSVHRFSTGARNKVEALKAEREEAARLDRLFKAGDHRSVATLAAHFLDNAEAVNRAEDTRKKSEEYLSRLIIPFLGEQRDATTITVRDLEDYKAMRAKQVGPSTVAKELSTFRQMLRFGGDVLKLFPPGEIPSTRSPRQPKYTPKWRLLNADELGRLLVELQRQDRKGREAIPFFLLIMNTGMRSGEPAKLRWDWVDMEKREIYLPAEVTKTRTARTIPMNDGALAALAMMRTPTSIGRVFKYRTHYTAWHRAVHAAGLARLENRNTKRPTSSGVRPHDLRHSFGSLLYVSGTTTPEVRDILGHATLMMANLYAHSFKERLHDAVNATVVGVPKTVPLRGRNVPENVVNGADVKASNDAVSATTK
jgi:integrase